MLIAIGIFVAGLFMCSILFLFVRERQAVVRRDWLFDIVRKYVRWTVRQTRTHADFVGRGFVAADRDWLFAIPRLHFQASTRSLQPKNIHASRALEEIMHKMPVHWEPVLAIVRGATPQELHDYWQKISARLRQLQAAGKIKASLRPRRFAFHQTGCRQIESA